MVRVPLTSILDRRQYLGSEAGTVTATQFMTFAHPLILVPDKMVSAAMIRVLALSARLLCPLVSSSYGQSRNRRRSTVCPVARVTLFHADPFVRP